MLKQVVSLVGMLRSHRTPILLRAAILAVVSVLVVSASSANEHGGELIRPRTIDQPQLCSAPADDPMGRGCCSWHQGECGCQNGRDVCCDGTLSPTCACNSLSLGSAGNNSCEAHSP